VATVKRANSSAPVLHALLPSIAAGSYAGGGSGSLGNAFVTDETITVGPYDLQSSDMHALASAIRHPAAFWVNILVSTVVTLSGFILMAMLAAAAFGFDPGEHLGALVAVGAIGSIVYSETMEWLVTTSTAHEQAMLATPTTLMISPQGLEIQNDKIKAHVSWRAIDRIAVKRKHVFLFSTRKSGWIVPRRAFTTPSAMKHFAEKAREWHAVS
jgi:hypothetical protein